MTLSGSLAPAMILALSGSACGGYVIESLETRASSLVRIKQHASDATWTEYTNTTAAAASDTESETIVHDPYGDPALRSFAAQHVAGANVAISEFDYPRYARNEVISTTTYILKFRNDGADPMPLKINFFIKYGEMVNVYPWNDPGLAKARIYESIHTLRTSDSPYHLPAWEWGIETTWDWRFDTRVTDWSSDPHGVGKPTYSIDDEKVTVDGFLAQVALRDMAPGEHCELRVMLGAEIWGWGETGMRAAVADPFDLDGDGQHDSGGGTGDFSGAGFSIDGETLPAPGTMAIVLMGVCIAPRRRCRVGEEARPRNQPKKKGRR